MGGLILGKSREKPLTRGQKAFNRWIRRIEMLRKDLAAETAQLDRLMGIYAAELHPLELALMEQRKALVRALRPFLKGRDLTGRRQRQTLRELLHEQLEEIASLTGPVWTEEDLRDLWNELDVAVRAREKPAEDALFQEMRSVVEAEFDAMGLKVDLSRLHPGMTPQDLEAALDDVHKQLHEAPDPGPKPRRAPPSRPGAKPRLSAEERERMEEEVRQRDLGSLYKQLAKLLHPDLESDPVLREDKEAAMKRLTIAYKARDLHALLELELEWIHREGADASRLSEQKLRVYNGILEEQVNELEMRINEISLHPRYAPLMRYCGPFGGPDTVNPQEARQELTAQLRELKSVVERVAGPEALRWVRQLIQEFRTQQQIKNMFF